MIVVTVLSAPPHTILQGADRLPGDRWMIRGPLEYVPPVEVEVVTKRKAIPLDENEGIYVRDIKTGRVRSHRGSCVHVEVCLITCTHTHTHTHTHTVRYEPSVVPLTC